MSSPIDRVRAELEAESKALEERYRTEGASQELSDAIAENAGGFAALTRVMEYETRLIWAQVFHMNDLAETRNGDSNCLMN